MAGKRPPAARGWKYYLGLALFVYSLVPVCTVAVMPFLGLSLAEAGTFTVVFLASGEVAFYGAAALLGKDFLDALKRRLAAWFRRAEVPPKPVGRSRHRAGVLLFAASFLPYYAALVYLLFFSHSEADITFLAWSMVAGEIIGIVAAFLLGPPFWEGLKNLFYWSEPPAPPG